MFKPQSLISFPTSKALLALAAFSLLVACAVSPATQAKIDEYTRTIPSCAGAAECQAKWRMATAWVEANSDFGIRSASDTRIVSTTNVASDSGIAIVVERIPTTNGRFQIKVDMECLSGYGCPQLWDNMVEFNRAVNTAN